MVLLTKSRDLAGAVARVTHEDEVSIRKPAYQARQQQPRDMRWRLMARAMHVIPHGGAVQGDQDWERPRPGGERPLDEPRDDHPLMSPAIGRIAVSRPHPIAMPPLPKHLRARVLSDRIVASQQHRPRWDHLVQQARNQGASQRPGRPSALGKHAMIGRYMSLCLILNGASQVGDGPSPRGQDSREHQD
jgi:hypothetical protein